MAAEVAVQSVSVPFRAGTEGYASFRIPAAVTAADGTVLAFAEGRVASPEDYGDIDLVLRRSRDGGRTWEPLTVVDANDRDTAGNPAPVVLDTGRILLVYVRSAAGATERRIRRGEVPAADGRRVWLRHSDDHGRTWSSAREITESVKEPGWRWYATGPGHALQLRQGPHAGRILVPANHSAPPTGSDTGAEAPYDGGHALLSDDRGATWRIGYTDRQPGGCVNANETTAAELPGGRLYITCRNQSPASPSRADAHSRDGGATLERPFRPQAGLTGPVVQGSVLHLGEPDVLLFSGPADPGSRAAMTLRASHDHGRTWRTVHTVDDLPAAYSDLVRVDASCVGLLYETGDSSAYTTITFRRIPVEELS